jgi:hypothetical protein
VDVGVLADIQQQIELLGEERIVVLERETEERERFDEGATTDDHLGAPVGDEVKRREFLEDANGIISAENLDGAGKANLPGAGCRSGKDDGGCGVEELRAMMLADAENVKADLIGQLHFFEEMLHALDRGKRNAVHGIGDGGGETVDTDLQWELLSVAND